MGAWLAWGGGAQSRLEAGLEWPGTSGQQRSREAMPSQESELYPDRVTAGKPTAPATPQGKLRVNPKPHQGERKSGLQTGPLILVS